MVLDSGGTRGVRLLARDGPWVTFAILLEPSVLSATGDSPVVHAASVSLVAVGIPFAVLTVMFPFAVFQDTQAIHRAEPGWEPPSGNYALVGLLGLVAAVIGGLLTQSFSIAVITGLVLSVPFALYYLRERHDNLGVPCGSSSLKSGHSSS